MNRHAKLSEVKDGYFVEVKKTFTAYFVDVKKTFTAPSKSDAIALAEDQGVPRENIKIKESDTNERD